METKVIKVEMATTFLLTIFLSLSTVLEGRRGSRALTTSANDDNSRRHDSKGSPFIHYLITDLAHLDQSLG